MSNNIGKIKFNIVSILIEICKTDLLISGFSLDRGKLFNNNFPQHITFIVEKYRYISLETATEFNFLNLHIFHHP